MSVQFGKCNFDGRPVDPKDLDRVRPVLAPYGPDGEGYICKTNYAILYRSFYTTRESRLEVQPHVSGSGQVFTWDGRLDNRKELIDQLAYDVSRTSTDLSIVVAAYQRWGAEAFARLTGDWALSVWDPRSGILILAKDFVGGRHLYYRATKDQVSWCTVLDPLVLCAGKSYVLDEEYLAGWLALFPEAGATPYVEIRSVPPACIVEVEKDTCQTRKYWDFDSAKSIRYRRDEEYEDHFRAVFSESVRRRLRSDDPVLAELSGGMDSSSIVCVADLLVRDGTAETPRIDTVSYYDKSEPNWNELPYFTQVEEFRGQVGLHIDAGADALAFDSGNQPFSSTPGCIENARLAPKQFVDYLAANDFRVLLCGIGGDEVCGGVPTPIPELADLLSRGRAGSLARALKAWSLNKRKPWLNLLLETFYAFLPARTSTQRESSQPAPWLTPDFVNRNQAVWQSNAIRLKLFGPLPSFQESIMALDLLRRQLAWLPVPSQPTYERRYPFLDRDLLTFLFAIPQEQLVRPGQRRSLMRRALAGLVPETVLNRKRKGFADRRPRVAALALWSSLVNLDTHLLSSSMGMSSAVELAKWIERLRQGRDVPVVALMRTLTLESWLRNVIEQGYVDRSLAKNPIVPRCRTKETKRSRANCIERIQPTGLSVSQI